MRARTDTYPRTLPMGFTDPYANTPLGCRREGTAGFVVYSVGADGSFQDGTAGQWPTTKQIVFRYPAPPPRPLPVDVLK